MPEANDSVETTGVAVLPQKTNGKPTTQREHKAQARESREDAINRAFGDLPADDLLGDDPPAVQDSTDDVDAESESPDKAEVTRLRGMYDDLQGKFDLMEARLATERERQAEPDEEPELDYEALVQAPDGWDAIKPSLAAIRKHADEQVRAVKKEQAETIRSMNLMRAELDLAKFGAQHPDFWQPIKPGGPRLCDVIAQVATKKNMDLFDYESISTMYDYVQGQRAIAELGEIKKKHGVQAEMSQKAGAVPRHRSTQQQVRDEQVAPGNGFLTFDQAFEKSKARLLRGQRR